ncbi:MAG: hypothetical protein IPK85_06960 [Gemmatimonadetes bacterium]|nr:hypothetical protein [Gemmatimonadota bacterium]
MDNITREPGTADAAQAVDALCGALVDVCWRQWGSLGRAAAPATRTIVDLEALLLASRWFAEDEPRLSSAATDWLASWEALVSTQRLRNLAARVAEWSLDGLEERAPLGRVAEPRPRVPSVRARRDATVAPVGRSAATLQLRLRLLLGVGAKADCVTLLLGRSGDEALPDWCLEQETAYGSHALRKVTRDLAWSGVLASSRDGQHGLRDRDTWWSLLQLNAPRRQVWVSWATVFSWAAACRRAIRGAAARDVSAYGLGGLLDHCTAVLGDPMPWTAPLRMLPTEQLTGIAGFIARCVELQQKVRDDG